MLFLSVYTYSQV